VTQPDWLDLGVRHALEHNRDAVERWLSDEAGAWGRIAGLAVLACRGRLGRALAEDERRAVWAEAWRRLELLRAVQNAENPDGE
jgi:hypothetical protein